MNVCEIPTVGRYSIANVGGIPRYWCRNVGVLAFGKVAGADRQTVYMKFIAARALFDMPTAVARIEVKLASTLAATQTAPMLMRATGVKATALTEENAQLFEGLGAQARTGVIIKAF